MHPPPQILAEYKVLLGNDGAPHYYFCPMPVKSKLKISQKFVAFSEYMSFEYWKIKK